MNIAVWWRELAKFLCRLCPLCGPQPGLGRGRPGMVAPRRGGEERDLQCWVLLAPLRRPTSPTLSSDRRPVVPVQSFCIPGVPPPLPSPRPADTSRRLPWARSLGRLGAPARAAVGAHKGPAGELASGSIATFRPGQVSLRPGHCFLGSPAPGTPPGVEGHGRLRRGFPSAMQSPWASDPERLRSSQRDPRASWPRKQRPASGSAAFWSV